MKTNVSTMKTNAMRFTKTKLSLALSGALLLSACGGSGQDDGSVGSSTAVSGLAIDGYLARATVYADSNNNATRDSWEPYAFTDDYGYYSYNPTTNTNYCASGATAEQARYCLKLTGSLDDVVIRIAGGYDLLTGEPFEGQLSRRSNLSTADYQEPQVISPITSLFTNVQSDVGRTSLRASLGISNSDLDVNYLNTDGLGTINSQLLNTSLKVHKTVSVLSDRLTDTYTDLGSERGLPSDASSLVYSNLAQRIINTGNSLDDVLSSTTDILSVLDNTESNVRSILSVRDFPLPTDMGSTSSPSLFTRVTEIATVIPSVVDNLIAPTDVTPEEAQGGSRFLEAILIRTVNETTTDTSIDNLINFADRTTNPTNLDQMLTNLGQPNGDLDNLVKGNFTLSSSSTSGEIDDASTLGESVVPFTQIGGLQIKISDLDLAGNTEDKELEIYFDGESGDINGEFSACVKFIDDANVSENSIGEGSTKGELVDGFWSLLGATSESVESYRLLLTLNFLGSTYQAIVKASGEETVESTVYTKVRTDVDGDLEDFHSLNGFETLGDIPTSHAECRSRLPSRIGLN